VITTNSPEWRASMNTPRSPVIYLVRSHLVEAKACHEGLAMFDEYAALQGRSRSLRLTWAHMLWAACDARSRGFVQWAQEMGLLPRFSLRGANLGGANLYGANLYGANLENVKGLFYQIPQEGELIVWKAVAGGVSKLRVPPEAKRTATPIGRKCRAEWVEVLEAPTNGRGLHDTSVIYRAGEIVRPDKYDPDPRVECTHGIHFFMTKEEAEAYR